jgi:hypothetical protein
MVHVNTEPILARKFLGEALERFVIELDSLSQLRQMIKWWWSWVTKAQRVRLSPSSIRTTKPWSSSVSKVRYTVAGSIAG